MIRQLTGSRDQPIPDGINRGVIVGVVQAIASVVALAVDADKAMMATMAPVVTFVGLMAFGLWDKYAKPHLPGA